MGSKQSSLANSSSNRSAKAGRSEGQRGRKSKPTVAAAPTAGDYLSSPKVVVTDNDNQPTLEEEEEHQLPVLESYEEDSTTSEEEEEDDEGECNRAFCVHKDRIFFSHVPMNCTAIPQIMSFHCRIRTSLAGTSSCLGGRAAIEAVGVVLSTPRSTRKSGLYRHGTLLL